MVYKGKSQSKIDDLGVLPFMEPPVWAGRIVRVKLPNMRCIYRFNGDSMGSNGMSLKIDDLRLIQ